MDLPCFAPGDPWRSLDDLRGPSYRRSRSVGVGSRWTERGAVRTLKTALFGWSGSIDWTPVGEIAQLACRGSVHVGSAPFTSVPGTPVSFGMGRRRGRPSVSGRRGADRCLARLSRRYSRRWPPLPPSAHGRRDRGWGRGAHFGDGRCDRGNGRRCRCGRCGRRGDGWHRGGAGVAATEAGASRTLPSTIRRPLR